MAKNARDGHRFPGEAQDRPAAEVRRRAGRVPPAQGQGNRRRECADPSLGLALLRNQLKKEKYNVDAEQLRVYFPYPARARRDVRHLPAHLRAEVRARRAAVQMDRRPAALRRLRRARPASRSGCSTSTCSRAKANTITSPQFRLIEGKLLPSGKYQRPTVALICNFPSPTKGQAVAALALATWRPSSTSSATRCTR